MQTSENKGRVYVVRGGDLYKIGATGGESAKRLKALTTGSPVALVIAHEIATSAYVLLERALHCHFSEKRIKGEWFDLTLRDIDFIQRLTAGNWRSILRLPPTKPKPLAAPSRIDSDRTDPSFDVKTTARLINRGFVQTYAAIKSGLLTPTKDSNPVRVPLSQIEKFNENPPRRGPKRKGKSNGK